VVPKKIFDQVQAILKQRSHIQKPENPRPIAAFFPAENVATPSPLKFKRVIPTTAVQKEHQVLSALFTRGAA